MPHFFFFFFQAEDGIRDVAVTGVQTCALPIFGKCDGANDACGLSARCRRAAWARFEGRCCAGWGRDPTRQDDFLKTSLSARPVTISQAIEGYQMVNPYRRF